MSIETEEDLRGLSEIRKIVGQTLQELKRVARRRGLRLAIPLVFGLLLTLTGCNQAGNAGGTTSGSASSGSGAAGSVGRSGGQSASDASVKNLKELLLGINMYMGDHTETYPSMSDAASVKQALQPYIKNSGAFVDPDTNEPYQFNAGLSGKTLTSISDPTGTVVVYEASPASDGTRGVAFANGTADRVSESEWKRLKTNSKIP